MTESGQLTLWLGAFRYYLGRETYAVSDYGVMAYEQRDNSGALFENQRKEKETHADYNGTIMVAGIEYWINAWVKEGPEGEFFSLAVEPKEPRANPGRQMPAPDADFDDDPAF